MTESTIASAPLMPSRARAAASPLRRLRIVRRGIYLLAALLVAICFVGFPYYAAPVAERVRSPLHPWLKPSGYIGQSAGLLAASIFLLLWLYPVRKRARWLAWTGSVARWLDLHVLAALVLPLLAAIPAAWRFGGLMGLGFWSMMVVWASGLVGRYLYLRIPRGRAGIELTLAEITTRRRGLLEQIAAQSGLEVQVIEQTLAMAARRLRRLHQGSGSRRRQDRQALARVLVVAVGVLCAAPVIAHGQQGAVENPHGTLAQPCNVCHSPEGWAPARVSAVFDHARAAAFPLAGAHATASCRACHVSLDFRGTSRSCVSCHTDPHRGEVGTDCARCHTARSFLDRSGMTGAHQLTRFPLAGSHLSVDCEACHAAPQGRLTFVALATECAACHLRDYQATRDPDHAASGFTTDCVQCHAEVSWLRTRFDHAATGFALTGAHLRITCSTCHGQGQFQALPAACVSCHQADYDQTTNPNHQGAQFPTDCASCHTTARWTGARFDHDGPFFPIFSGTHRGKWSSCSDCHVNANDFRQFDCVHCHQNAHRGRGYTSPQCYSCHPTGRGGD